MDAGQARDIIDKQIPSKTPEPVSETVDWNTSKPDQAGAPSDWPTLEQQLKALGYSNEEMDMMTKAEASSIVDSVVGAHEQPTGEELQKPDIQKQLEALGVKSEPEEGDFVKASDGTPNFGVVVEGKDSIPIRLQVGNNEYGKVKIDNKHGQDIKDAGYKDVESFIEDVAKNYNEIWDQPNGRLMLVKRNGDAKVSVIELREKKGEPFYGVTSAFISDPGYPSRGGRKLRLGEERTLSASPEQLTPLTNTAPSEAQVDDAWRTGKSNSSGYSLTRPDEAVKENQKPTIEEQLKAIGIENPLKNQSGAVDVDKLADTADVDMEKLKEQIKPHLDEIVAAGKEIKSIFAPASMSEEAALVAGSLRERNALMDRKKDIAVAKSKEISAFFDSQPKEANYQFIDDMELGKKQANPQLQEIADIFRKALDDRFEKVNKLDPNAQISYSECQNRIPKEVVFMT
ncbi:MAG: hypothetical protein L7F77_14405 [Candidatus Magnetominusculus sp. LBB02]|nr:hypothetical protein [Candidatus Magnetominusculus sp. LBB02]